ncbi:MAG TPA: hypothetical protein PK867_17675 [Pirellulales bacterium]|nr:hypothetical protein [Pirellulales bacterium]
MTTDAEELVNGLPLPSALVEAIQTGRWVAPLLHKLEAVFPLAADEGEPICHPAFFDLDGMQRENDGWSEETLPSYLGEKDDKVQPGDIDPSQSIVIADLGPDRLVALDYRVSDENPRVVYLTGNQQPRWVEAAPNVESLMRLLGL